MWSEIGACCNLVVHVSENKNDQLNINLDLDLPLDLFPVVDYIYAQIWSLYFRHVCLRESPGRCDDIHFQSSKSLFFKSGTKAKYL